VEGGGTIVIVTDLLSVPHSGLVELTPETVKVAVEEIPFGKDNVLVVLTTVPALFFHV
jgi:hypothetical protein